MRLLDKIPQAIPFYAGGSGGGGPLGPATRLRREGRVWVNAGGLFRPRFTSGLLLLLKSDDEIRAFLDWAVSTGFNGIRVFAGALAWTAPPLTVERSRERLPFLLTEASQRGLYVEVTAVTDSYTGYDVDFHVRQVADICASFENTLLEIANEPEHGTQSEQVHDVGFREHLARYALGRVPVALGEASGESEDEVIENVGNGDYATFHLARDPSDPWDMIRRIRDMEGCSAFLDRPVMNNEPIGAAEPGHPGQRMWDPTVFFAFGVLNRLFEVGGVHHSQHGLMAELPGPVQQQCADAYVEGTMVIPTNERLRFYNARWAGSPIAEANFDGDGRTIVRAFSGVLGNQAWTALIGLTGDPQLRLGDGWRIVRVVAERPGIQVIELQRD